MGAGARAPPPNTGASNTWGHRWLASRAGWGAQVVAAACDALRRRHGKGPTPALDLPPSAFVTALLVPAGGAIALDLPALEGMGIR